MAPGPVTYGPPSLPALVIPHVHFTLSSHLLALALALAATHVLFPSKFTPSLIAAFGVVGGRRRVFNLHPQATRSTLPLPPHLCAVVIRTPRRHVSYVHSHTYIGILQSSVWRLNYSMDFTASHPACPPGVRTRLTDVQSNGNVTSKIERRGGWSRLDMPGARPRVI